MMIRSTGLERKAGVRTTVKTTLRALWGAPDGSDQRKEDAIEFFVSPVAQHYVVVKTPMLHLLNRLPGQHLGQRAEGFDFEKIVIREGLERAAKIGIGLAWIGELLRFTNTSSFSMYAAHVSGLNMPSFWASLFLGSWRSIMYFFVNFQRGSERSV